MNNSRASQRVRVIRLDEPPTREAVGSARVAGIDPSNLASTARPPAWPQPIGSGEVVPFAAPAAARSAQAEPPVDAPPAPVLPDEPTPRHLPRGEVRAWPVRVWSEPAAFAGQFWRQMLLVLCTAGLYAPWAVAHLRRFLWRHTRVVGRSLDDHEPAVDLARQWLLGLGLLMGVVMSWRSSDWLGLAAASVAVLVWPHLLFLRLRQRAAHVSWARRRMGFAGRCSQVYQAVWPMVLATLALMWASAAAWHWSRPVGWCAWGLGLSCWMMGLPLVAWTWLHWRQGHLRFGPWAVWWTAPREGMVSLFWRTVTWLALAAILVMGVLATGWALLRLGHVVLGPLGHAVLLGAPVMLLAVAVRAYAQARLQNLVWGKTGNRHVRFQSRLNVAAYVQQQCRHAMLMVLTAGLYWPWAVAATHRMRMQAITVWSRVDVDELRAHWPVGPRRP